ncbi:MAG: extracellular solute-binding protein, partial [Candidatus Paceibacterota bacterium]
SDNYKDQFSMVYKYFDPTTFEDKLLEALASGNGPDIVIIPSDLIYRQSNKIVPIPYESYPERGYRDNFIDGGEIFLAKDGVLAIPFYVDPLVMYWNKDIFSSVGLARPPKVWDDLQDSINKLTIADRNANVTRSAIAMGTFNNVDYAKDILSMLFLQAGVPIVERKVVEDGREVAVPALAYSNGASVAALDFFMQFADPARPAYSWNTAMPSSMRAFSSGSLALYIGYSSDYKKIKEINPHLNFDVSSMPQRNATGRRDTFAKIYGLALLKSSKNAAAAGQVMAKLDSNDLAQAFVKATGFPSARREVVGGVAKDPNLSVYNDSSIISFAFLDPSPAETKDIFSSMISSVSTGKRSKEEALTAANAQLGNLLK